MTRHEEMPANIGDALSQFAEDWGLPAHFYFHVPFCRTKCAYCDFASVSGADAQTVFAVFSGIESELRRWSVAGLPGVVETLYFGGGTPSFRWVQVVSVLEDAFEHLPVRRDAEVTIEANPDSLDSDAVRALPAAGATRISVGVQSFDASVLRLLGRCHDVRQARAACDLVLDAGLELSIDLICGVPGQSPASWESTLDMAVGSGAKHVSVYPLSVEPGTPLAVAVDTGLIEDVDADAAAGMMETAEEALGAAGLQRYEVANYASPGHESRHNTAYWTGRPYVGIGPGAHGMLPAETAKGVGILAEESSPGVSRVRYGEPRDIEEWLTGRAADIELLTEQEAAREDVMLGLRLTRGVSANVVESAGLTPVLGSLEADGLIERVGDSKAAVWRTTRRGWLLGNEVFSRVWEGT